MWHYITVNTVSELVCLVFAALCLAKDDSWAWRGMILYMLVTCLAEFSGVYVERAGHFNNWIYNVFLLFEAAFNSLMFAFFYSRYHKSKIVIIGVVLFVALYFFQLVRHGLFAYDNLTYTVMSVAYVLYSLYYYYLLIKEDRHVNLKYSPAFWWVAGTLFFYFGNTACNLFTVQFGDVTLYRHISYFIFKVLNVGQYGFWSYSFICKKWLITKSEASS